MVDTTPNDRDTSVSAASDISKAGEKKKRKAPLVRKVTDYLVYIEEVLGIG